MRDRNGWNFQISTDTILVVFVVLKLTNVIDWSWWWVLSPALIDLLLSLLEDKYKD